MKKSLLILAVAALVATASCTDKKASANVEDNDSTSVAVVVNEIDLANVAGTYEGTLPAADCPGIKMVLTINADSTYQMTQDYMDRKDGHDEASGVFDVLDGNVLMLVRPSSGEHTFYKVKDGNSIVLTDSLGNEAEGESAELYVLKKTK
ncbi:MAG: copper resistance protein NlpE [Bacteroidales bacterium]|nr:copper resistance protein NlpE [Bacteroidales bacterium]